MLVRVRLAWTSIGVKGKPSYSTRGNGQKSTLTKRPSLTSHHALQLKGSIGLLKSKAGSAPALTKAETVAASGSGVFDSLSSRTTGLFVCG